MIKHKFAIIGCGVIGKVHAECLTYIENAELVAVCDVVEERARALGEKFNCSYYTDIEKMLREQDDIEIVNICTPTGLHAECGVICAKAGKHIICEKPIDVNEENAAKLIKVCEDAGVKLSVISQHRFDKGVVELKKAVERGEIGKLYFGGSYTKWYRSQEYYDSGEWRGTWALDGGGALMNQSIHYVDLLQYIMGPIEEIYASCASIGHERIEVEDEAIATVRFKNGAIGVIEGTTNAYPGLFTRLDIYGEKASVVIENDKVVLWKYKNGTEKEVVDKDRNIIAGSSAKDISNYSHILQFKDVIEAIEENRKPKVDGYEGLKPLKIILAIYKSNRERNPVKL
ncbi:MULTISPECIES: Gfo/Idh/MocA family protein [Thermoanaerobacterium]|uniref:Oxidoreductase domain-containing protein n=2 Tax=Thermoanaerobacterium TaxID=28895 RepID=W9E7Z7_9THEO|nr:MULTISPECIES: Gfo/Idh/MocA family oxidoreductase [Thermoanaerobacterium]AFK85524.1 oxidoreductase domain protein [Thermoanaerobacterium saccharolyticum JW/SL-YS485]ETO37833.1 oxidoreductase domain-containing protein [Thermoanaerobacterium aotearoense SCUT27]